MEGFSDCLRLETQQFGIDVVLVEPGGVKSEWADISAEHIESVNPPVFAAYCSKDASHYIRRLAQFGKSQVLLLL